MKGNMKYDSKLAKEMIDKCLGKILNEICEDSFKELIKSSPAISYSSFYEEHFKNLSISCIDQAVKTIEKYNISLKEGDKRNPLRQLMYSLFDAFYGVEEFYEIVSLTIECKLLNLFSEYWCKMSYKKAGIAWNPV